MSPTFTSNLRSTNKIDFNPSQILTETNRSSTILLFFFFWSRPWLSALTLHTLLIYYLFSQAHPAPPVWVHVTSLIRIKSMRLVKSQLMACNANITSCSTQWQRERHDSSASTISTKWLHTRRWLIPCPCEGNLYGATPIVTHNLQTNRVVRFPKPKG